mmetsp:Transcript_174110/g.558257  ORF Transcript_174110/g.558257 Transcript_174110/m.558257 type:complete len:247 (+) Transcript_174110:443-1183(+)
MSRASWDTKMKPPSYLRKAEIISSTDSMSRWLVGSSNIKISGRLHVRSANCTRAFWPPDSSLIGRVCACVGKPNCPKLLWACSFFSMPAPKRRTSGCVRSSTGLRVSLSPSSSKCWEYRPIDKPFEWLTSPWLGQSIFESKLRRVLLPAPFLPTTAMRSHALMRKLSFGPRSQGAFPFQLKLMSWTEMPASFLSDTSGKKLNLTVYAFDGLAFSICSLSTCLALEPLALLPSTTSFLNSFSLSCRR